MEKAIRGRVRSDEFGGLEQGVRPVAGKSSRNGEAMNAVRLRAGPLGSARVPPRQAHEHNDEVLERIYIGRRFRNDTERLERLFAMYRKVAIQ